MPRVKYDHFKDVDPKHCEFLKYELLHGCMPPSEVADRAGITRDKLRALAKQLGVSMSERRIQRVNPAIRRAKIDALIRHFIENPGDQSKSTTVLSRKLHSAIYLIEQALAEVNEVQPRKNNYIDPLDAPWCEISREWLARPWRANA